MHARAPIGADATTSLLPLAGAFQASNALVAAGLAIAAGDRRRTSAIAALAAPQRRAGPARTRRPHSANGAPIFVDYAHKPDALAVVLAALRPMTRPARRRLRRRRRPRRGKRPLMGEVAADAADVVIVTDDNPRTRGPRRDPRARSWPPCPGAHRDRRPRRGDRARQSPCFRRRRAGASPARATRPARSSASELPFSDHERRPRARSRAEEAA